MNTRTSTVLSTLQGIQRFLTDNDSDLGVLNTSGSRQALDDLENTLSAHATNQSLTKSGGKAAIARQQVLKSILLVKYLKPISAIAEAQLSQAPDFVALKLPKSLRTTPQLLAAASAMAGAAAKHADTFVKFGMAPTFIADLEAAANDVKNGAALKGNTLTSKMGSTSALKAATQQAHKVVKQLDALIEPLLAGNTALLSQWKATKRFTGKAQNIAAGTISSAGTTSVPVADGTSASPAVSAAAGSGSSSTTAASAPASTAAAATAPVSAPAAGPAPTA